MPWKEQNVMESRQAFINDYLEDRTTMSALCLQHGITTKTGYKWLKRFKENGYSGLEDMSKRPHEHSQQLTEKQLCDIIRLKKEFMEFGPKKIHNLYNRSHQKDISLSSVSRILKRSGFTKTYKKRRVNSLEHKAQILEAQAPNDIWTIDFKGHWPALERNKCEPLTVVDQYSRYILYSLPLERSDGEHVKETFIRLFKQYGMPKAIKSDNGPPFSHSLTPRGISTLSNWLMSLNIEIHRIQPAKPSQNGKHERMHRDLKALVQIGPRLSMKEYHESLKMFQNRYNYKRPHEALDMKFPSEVYKPSDSKYQEPSKDIDYPKDMIIRRVYNNGQIKYESNPYGISQTLAGYQLGLKFEENDISVYFCDVLLGHLKEELRLFKPLKSALQLQVNESNIC
jgi:transposase InsO family protein